MHPIAGAVSLRSFIQPALLWSDWRVCCVSRSVRNFPGSCSGRQPRRELATLRGARRSHSPAAETDGASSDPEFFTGNSQAAPGKISAGPGAFELPLRTRDLPPGWYHSLSGSLNALTGRENSLWSRKDLFGAEPDQCPVPTGEIKRRNRETLILRDTRILRRFDFSSVC